MTTVCTTIKRNPATKIIERVERHRITFARKHGRPGNIGKVMKVRRIKEPTP